MMGIPANNHTNTIDFRMDLHTIYILLYAQQNIVFVVRSNSDMDDIAQTLIGDDMKWMLISNRNQASHWSGLFVQFVPDV